MSGILWGLTRIGRNFPGSHRILTRTKTDRKLSPPSFDRFFPRQNPIQTKKVMTPRPVTLNLDDSIRFALHQMSVGGFRHIPIISPNQPLRIISARDVLGYVCQLTNTSTS